MTGLQSYPKAYEEGIPLNAMSDWGWHSFENKDNLRHEETLGSFNLGHGHDEVYAVEYKKGGRPQEATNYFRVNPHRLNLGTVGLELRDRQGNKVALNQLTDIRQEQHLWKGTIESRFSADGTPIEVTTGCMADKDAVFARIKSPLLANGQATVSIRLPYPTGRHADAATDWNSPEKHRSEIIASDSTMATIAHTIDHTTYYVTVKWEGKAQLKEVAPHHFQLSTQEDILTFCTEYTQRQNRMRPEPFEYDQALKALMKYWPRFWNSGAIVDFSECTDPRAAELERRTVLSQYLTAINCANQMPPQETGLTYNSWFGRPHLEMTWWHAVDFALWKRPEVVETMMEWYNQPAYEQARKIAERQGFKGVRWMKMTDLDAGEAPSNTGSFLTWQQPHYIYLAEELYRAHPTQETLKKYAEQVEATAEFMADFAKACDPGKKSPIKLFGQTAMQESMSKDFSYNHPFEQAYWHYGLSVAQRWRERQGLERHAEWDDIIARMAPLVEKDGRYVSGEPLTAFDSEAKAAGFDPFTSVEQTGRKEISAEDFALKCRSDHPAVLGACGLLPASRLYNNETMKKTLDWVMNNWNWETTWGWDYGMIALCAARLGEPETALQALLIEKGKNTYLPNGHNFQEPKRLRLYLPGNGAFLDAIALMCAGWDGCPTPNNPGFPDNGKWNVRWEGLNRMQ